MLIGGVALIREAQTDAPTVSTSAQGIWIGGEQLFWMGGIEGRAFNPSTQTWRVFPAGGLSGRVDGAVVAAGDVLLIWGGFVNGPPVSEAGDGIAYRVPTSAAG